MGSLFTPNVAIPPTIPPSQLPAANIWPSPENARHVTAVAAFLGVVASRRIRVGSAEAKSQKMKPAAARLGWRLEDVGLLDNLETITI